MKNIFHRVLTLHRHITNISLQNATLRIHWKYKYINISRTNNKEKYPDLSEALPYRSFSKKKTLDKLALNYISIKTQPTITCSKFTIETLEQGVKYVQS